MFQRRLSSELEATLRVMPVVLLRGGRQTGKTTLCRALVARGDFDQYVTLDDPALLQQARTRPSEFIDSLPERVVIDEVQRAPEIFLPIKMQVDRHRRPGRFLLSGSANVMALPRLADGLTGRMGIVTLWPLSQGEIEGRRENFLESCFEPPARPPAFPAVSRADLVARLLRGGFPDVVRADGFEARDVWFGSYVRTLVERDLRDLADIVAATSVPAVLALIASRTGNLHNLAEVSRSVGVPATTLSRHLVMLELLYLIQRVPGWTSSASRRFIRAPKFYLGDTGVASWLSRVTPEMLEAMPERLGPLLENFVFGELVKQGSWRLNQPILMHWRAPNGREVDFVLEGHGRRVVGIEVKGTRLPHPADFRGLEALRDAAGSRFACGILLHTGEESRLYANGLLSLPVSALWHPW